MIVILKTILNLYSWLSHNPKRHKDNRHSDHVGVPNKRNNQNSFNMAAMTSGENQQ